MIFEEILYWIFFILNTNRLVNTVNTKGSIFVRITDKIENKHIDSVTKINQSLTVSSISKCIVKCANNNFCKYANFNKYQCNLYESIFIQPIILAGTIWTNKNNQFSYEKTTNLTITYSINQLTGSGYTKVYDQFYSNTTTITQLENIKSQCNISTILCAGGGLVNSNSIMLMSCANCHAVLTETILNEPVFVGSAYWYMTPTKSFGFSPSSKISQDPIDFHVFTSDPYRLSWSLVITSGWRLGNKTSSNDNSSNYKKYIFIK